MKRIYFLFFVVLCSCGPNLYNLDKKSNVTYVGIHLKFEDSVPEAVQTEMESNLKTFVGKYNAEKHRLKSFVSDVPDSSSITIHVFETALVSNGKQWAGVLVSAAGLSLPFIMISAGAPIAVFVYYFPRATSTAQVFISDDIALNDGDFVPLLISSPAFLKRKEKQIDRHGVFFQRYLAQIFASMEKSLRK